MRLALYIALQVFTLVGCGYFESHGETEPADVSQLDELREEILRKRQQYVEASDQATGWPDVMDCDGVLHAGVACAGGASVRIDLAEGEPGKLGRRPSNQAACWTAETGDTGSRSETSADMALGYAFCRWRMRDLGAMQRLADYGEAHSVEVLGLPAWVLGEPYPEQEQRVVLRPGLVGLVGRMIEAMSGGRDLRPYRSTPNVYSALGEDYQQRLAALGIVLGGEVDQVLRRGDSTVPDPDSHDEVPAGVQALVAIDGAQLGVLKKLAEERPDWPLFQAAYARYSGDYEPAYRVLLGELRCPSYTRGSRANCLADWLLAASLIVKPGA